MSTTSAREYRIEEYGNLQNTKKYPNPFFDISRNFMPKSIKTLFPYCRVYYYRNEFLNSVMKKLVSYPITDVMVKNYESVEDKERWEKILHQVIKIKDLLIRIGLSYNILGNAIGSINLVFRRYLKCEHCQEETAVEKVVKRKYVDNKYKGSCPKCGKHNNQFKIKDVTSTGIDDIRIILWSPERLDIVYNEFTGESIYYYNINNLTKKEISDGKLELIDTLPEVFLDAAANNKKIKLDPSNIFHLKQPTLPEDDQGWGKPVILPAMSLIFYMQILRRGNEAIAWEHIVPLRILFPAATSAMDPMTQNNLGNWRAKIDEGIKKWKTDPNHVLICPIPLGVQNMGGDAKALMVTPELKFLEELIINSMGIPVEFVKGGATWTGSSISLRIVENGFIQYRDDIEKLLNNFLIPKVATLLSISKVRAELRRLRMHDDAETKNLYVGLNQTGKISNTTMLEEIGIDPESDKKRKDDDIEFENKVKEKMAMGDAKAQSVMMKEQARAQAQAEYTYTDEKARIDEKLFEEEIANEQSNQDMGTGEYDPSVLIHKWALELLASPPQAQQNTLMKMQKTMPTTATLIVKRMQLIQNDILVGTQALVEAQQDEADRDVKMEQIKSKEKSDKQKGQTRGTP